MADTSELMTVEEFNNLVSKWAMKIRMRSKATLRTKTEASGKLAMSLVQFVGKLSDHDPAYKVKFQFERYGVYRAYGAGRGYVVVNGLPVRGYRVRSDSEIRNKKMSAEAVEMAKNGYLTREINRAKKIDMNDLRRKRRALDWIDSFLEQGREELADYVQEFYGDDAMRQVLKVLPKMKIVK